MSVWKWVYDTQQTQLDARFAIYSEERMFVYTISNRSTNTD